jgi:hypothetical protein
MKQVVSGQHLMPAKACCFIGFYGLDRSLRWTAPSIRKNILAPLKREGFRCLIAGHFNRPDIIDHPASGERGVVVRHPPTRYLDFDMLWIEPQSVAQASPLINAALSVPFRDYEDPTGGVRRNIVYQMHSLARLAQLAELAQPSRFQVFLLLRPDIEYIDPLDMDAVRSVVDGQADIVSPSWHMFGGLNDRFCIANYKGGRAYLTRGDHLEAYCAEHGHLHPESLLKAAVEHAGLRVRLTDQRALRVRATGETRAEGFHLPKPVRLIHRARPLLNWLP